MRRLVVCLLASFIVSAGILSFQQKAAGQTKFSDVDQSDWAYDEIQYLVGKGVIDGYPDGTFRPNATLKREQAVKMVGAALGYGGKKRDTKFPDVNPDNYASGYIHFGVEQGYIHGYPDGTFRPKRKMQRDEMAWLISGAFSLKNMSESLWYSDMNPKMNSYEAVNKVTTAGINVGYPDGTFRPNSNITRREFAVMVARAMDDKFKVTPSPLQGMKIVVDAGHGGWDPGAQAVDGTYEKKLNLQFSRKLQNDLENLGADVLMTRSSDQYVSLAQRTNFANSHNADLFLSIHHNWNDDNTADGVSLHYSSYRPELDQKGVVVTFNRDYWKNHDGPAYKWVKELTDTQQFVYLKDGERRKAYYSCESCRVAWAFDNTPSRAAVLSGKLARAVDDSLTTSRIDIFKAPRDHNLRVTRHTNMTSVLIELGFLSNPDELRLLENQDVQARRAQRLANAIETFYENH
ncbi:MAG TPA: N-acetylmuramoyl-L-alanine amidase [Bacillales bacterium]